MKKNVKHVVEHMVYVHANIENSVFSHISHAFFFTLPAGFFMNGNYSTCKTIMVLEFIKALV